MEASVHTLESEDREGLGRVTGNTCVTMMNDVAVIGSRFRIDSFSAFFAA